MINLRALKFKHTPKPNSSFLADFSELLSSIVLNHDIIIVGDFNIHIDDPLNHLSSEIQNKTPSTVCHWVNPQLRPHPWPCVYFGRAKNSCHS